MVCPISVCRHSFMVWLWGLVSKLVHHTFAKETNTAKTCVSRGGREAPVPNAFVLLVVIGWLRQNLRTWDASRILNHHLLELGLMYASSFLSSAGRTLELYIPVGINQLAGVRGPPHTVILLLQAQHRAAIASQARGYVLAEGVACRLVDELDPALGFPPPRRYSFLVVLSNDSSISSSILTGIIDSVGACRTGGGESRGVAARGVAR
jgi:hypothetical protein